MKFVVTTNQNSIIDPQKNKDKRIKHNTTESYQITKGESKRRKNKEQLPKPARKQLTKW